jgi:chromosome segregation protein
MAERAEVEKSLTASRENIEQGNTHLRELEEARARAARLAGEERAALDAQRLQWQDLRTRRGGLADQVAEQGANVELVAPQIDAAATVEQWEADLHRIEQRITRLGPINLAAIDEYRSQSERKAYLDEQNDDLDAALNALTGAIREIDSETRVRFRETFDKVNTRLQELFPKVFGGGSAELELTGDDLLDTGVTLMARPPGKRNSSIHLLSGGEKALTAISLIMSIFHLNPSPVCMLDEVDAPLDDTNVGRYAGLIKEMSSEVQFIFVTHNKIAMEMADQLMGVTMQEPGVSRLVTVDMDKAVALAQA